jgi:hypothetical protein
LDALGYVAVRPIEFTLNTQIPYSTLATPQNYKLNDYKPSKNAYYVPKHENRAMKLRTGAADEYMPADFQPHTTVQTNKPKTIVNKTRGIKFADLNNQADTSVPQIIDLSPPAYLAQPIEYPEMTIFVSCSKANQIRHLANKIIILSVFQEPSARSTLISKNPAVFECRFESPFKPVATIRKRTFLYDSKKVY